jgi:Ca2+-binding EF-hand superfamily protein
MWSNRLQYGLRNTSPIWGQAVTKLSKIAFLAVLITSLHVADSYAQRGREGGSSFGGRMAIGGASTGSSFGGRGSSFGGRDRSGSSFGGRDRSGSRSFGGGSVDRSQMMSSMAARFDSNGDGKIEPSEFQNIPERFRGMLERNGVRVDRPVSVGDFGAQVSKGFEKMRAEREAGGGDPGQRRDSSRQTGGTNGQPVPASFFVMPARVKVLIELSEELAKADVDQDGMVALYEWTDAGKPFEDYFKLDRNDDGFVTAQEEQGDPEVNVTRFKSDRLTIVTATSTVANASSKLSFSDPRLAKSRSVSQYSKPEEDKKRASSAFSGLDKNRDGKITSDEWAQSKKIRSWFESNKIKLTDMNAEQFSKTYGQAIAKYREDQEKKKRGDGDRRR